MVQYFPIVTGSLTVTGSVLVSGSITTNSTITATTLVVQTITSSISAITGSTNFGSLSSNTHTFTGSVNISSSLTVASGSTTPTLTVAGGLVGIGMSPVYKLDVGDAIRGLDILAGGNTFAYDGTIRARNAANNTNVLLHSNGSSYFLGGNMGIGTSSPTGLGGTVLMLSAASNYPELVFERTGTGARKWGALVGSDSTWLFRDYTAGNNVFKIVSGAPDSSLVIASGGGIAINSPSDSSMSLSVKGTYGNWTAFFQANTSTSNSYGPLIYAGTTSGDHAFYVANASGGTVFFRIRGDNLIFMPQLAAGTMTMSAGGYIQTSSDANFKTEAGTIDNGLDKVLKLKPRYFYWNEESGFEDKEKQLGFFAQEVNEVLGDEVASNRGENSKWGIHDRGIIAHLVSAIQELNTKFEDYKATHP